jgi:hypothetical protein
VGLDVEASDDDDSDDGDSDDEILAATIRRVQGIDSGYD